MTSPSSASWSTSLEARGYATHVRLADAWRYGVPQHRKRLILLARNDGQPFSWPEEHEGITDLREAIGDLPRLGDGDRRARARLSVAQQAVRVLGQDATGCAQAGSSTTT